MRLRTGRKAGRTIYAQLGDEPSDDDQLVGVMDTAALSQLVVDAVNDGREESEDALSFALERRNATRPTRSRVREWVECRQEDGMSDHHYAIGYEDGWAGRPFHPEWLGSREYSNGWRDGRAAFDADLDSTEEP